MPDLSSFLHLFFYFIPRSTSLSSIMAHVSLSFLFSEPGELREIVVRLISERKKEKESGDVWVTEKRERGAIFPFPWSVPFSQVSLSHFLSHSSLAVSSLSSVLAVPVPWRLQEVVSCVSRCTRRLNGVYMMMTTDLSSLSLSLFSAVSSFRSILIHERGIQPLWSWL